jgi:nucleotide-binding universal stress UspA family protein
LRHEEKAMFKTILFPTDGSEHAFRAGQRAVELAQLAGSDLVAVYVREPYPVAGALLAGAAGLQQYIDDSRAAAQSAFERIEAVAREAGVRLATRLEEDQPAPEAIVAAAKAVGADLVVMGSHGRTGLARVLLGNVANKVLATAQVPVLIVK